LVSPDHHPLAGKAKDVAAGAVLLTAIAAIGVGILIFLPKIIR
jgi:diacylglycerol kinase